MCHTCIYGRPVSSLLLPMYSQNLKTTLSGLLLLSCCACKRITGFTSIHSTLTSRDDAMLTRDVEVLQCPICWFSCTGTPAQRLQLDLLSSLPNSLHSSRLCNPQMHYNSDNNNNNNNNANNNMDDNNNNCYKSSNRFPAYDELSTCGTDAFKPCYSLPLE